MSTETVGGTLEVFVLFRVLRTGGTKTAHWRSGRRRGACGAVRLGRGHDDDDNDGRSVGLLVFDR